jgi:hypothetical protein
MLFMRVGIYVGAIGGLLAAVASIEAGVAMEAATVRALVVFLALTMAGYFADLVVVTAPPARLDDEYGYEDESDIDAVSDRAGDEQTPASIAAAREGTAVAAPDRRAA